MACALRGMCGRTHALRYIFVWKTFWKDPFLCRRLVVLCHLVASTHRCANDPPMQCNHHRCIMTLFFARSPLAKLCSIHSRTFYISDGCDCIALSFFAVKWTSARRRGDVRSVINAIHSRRTMR